MSSLRLALKLSMEEAGKEDQNKKSASGLMGNTTPVSKPRKRSNSEASDIKKTGRKSSKQREENSRSRESSARSRSELLTDAESGF